MKRAAALIAVGLLAACKGSQEPDETATEVPPQVVATPIASGVVESKFGTPVKDRIATIGLLNKRNNLTQDLVMKPGEAKRVGNVVVRVATCEKTLPWEEPPETGAFVQVYVEERATPQDALAWHRVFSGWLFKNAPSLNVVEHPVYDVWVKDCAMKFPGEEENPAAAASSSSAAKASGKPSGTPSAPSSAKPPVQPSASASASAAPD
jgi:hypothetical protein